MDKSRRIDSMVVAIQVEGKSGFRAVYLYDEGVSINLLPPCERSNRLNRRSPEIRAQQRAENLSLKEAR